MSRSTPTIGFLATLLIPAGAAAQQAWQIEIVPRVGVYAPQRELGTTARADGLWNLRLGRVEAVPAFELLAQAGLPGGRFAVRASALAAAPSSATGYFDCNPGFACPSIALTSDAETTVLAGVFDLVVSPFGPRAAVRPYVVAGAGAKRYRYAWPNVVTAGFNDLAGVVMVTAGHATETTLALHAGAGLDIDLFGAPLRLEVSDYWSPRGRAIQSPRTVELDIMQTLPLMPAARRHPQHDLAVSIGYRVVVF